MNINLVRSMFGIFLLAVAINEFHTAYGLEVLLQQVEIIKGAKIPGKYDIALMRVTKFNRTTYVLNVQANLEDALGDGYWVRVDFYHSRLGDTNFAKSPARFERNTFCNSMKKVYDSSLMRDLIAASNLPKNYTCPIPKDNYWVKSYQIDSKKITPWLPGGLWRAEIIFSDASGKETCIIHAIARIETQSPIG